MEVEFSWQIFEKSPILNVIKIRPLEAKFFPADGQTDRYDEANSRFSKFCESA
jgi:hypothetical protein